MKYTYLILIILLVSQAGFSQPPTSEANKLRGEGKLEEAIVSYKREYYESPTNWKNTYDLACAYALTFQKDSAFHYLTMALKDDYSLWALADADLYALADDPRWLGIENNQIERFQSKNNSELKHTDYVKKLLRLIVKDQALDFYIDQAKRAYMREGMIPHWYYPLGAMKERIGKENYSTMQELINTYGWPKYSMVGKLAADAPLLVINHHSDDAVRKEYISQIKQSCLENEGSCMEYAKIQDRILVNDNQLQLYGMQFRYTADRNLEPFPIKDPQYVDERRKEIGLGPLSEYLKSKINYDWKVDQKNRNE